MCTENATIPNRFIALEIHKHYFVAVGVDPRLNQILGPQRVKIRAKTTRGYKTEDGMLNGLLVSSVGLS